VLLTVLGLALVAAVAIFTAWPLLRGAEPEPEVRGGEASARLAHERDAALAAIREIDFDHGTGKLSDEDHAALRAELERRALAAIAALERPAALGPEAAAEAAAEFCAHCGHPLAPDARFCTRCGARRGAKRRGRRARAPARA